MYIREHQCRTCRKIKSVLEFDKNRRVCKLCRNDYQSKQNTKRRKQKIIEKEQWQKDNFEYLEKLKQEKEIKKQERLVRYRSNSNQYKRLWLYGLKEEQYQELLIRSQGKCAICKEFCNKLNIDHDYKTGRVRDLLCPGCNKGLGNFKEDPKLFVLAIEYLIKHNRDERDEICKVKSES